MSSIGTRDQKYQHTFLYLNLTLFIVFDIDTESLFAFVCKRKNSG